MKKVRTLTFWSPKASRLPFILLICLFSVLVLVHLDNRAMYADEAVTAMLGKNILSFGIPKAWDGENLVLAAVNGNEFNPSLVYIRDNWLSYYLAAGGQWIGSLFGADTYESVEYMRFLFGLASIAGMIGFYFLAADITQNKQTTFYALLLYTFSVPVLLHARSVYYVPLGLAFMSWTFYFYRKSISGHKRRDWALFTVCSVLLFHSLFVYFFIAMFAIATDCLIFKRKNMRLKEIAVPLLLIGLLTLPWWIYQRSFLNQVETNLFIGNKLFPEAFLGYIWQIHAYFLPFIPLAAICLLLGVIRKIRKGGKRASGQAAGRETVRRRRVELLVFLMTPVLYNIVIVSLFSSFLETRWLFPCLPFLFLIGGYMFHYISRCVRPLGIAILCITVFTNIFHVSPYLLIRQFHIEPSLVEAVVKPPVPFFNSNDSSWLNKRADLSEYLLDMCVVQSYPLNFVEEISNDLQDADKGMMLFLQAFGKRGQRVYMTGFQYEAAAYYSQMQVTNRLDPSSNPLPNFYRAYPNATAFYHLTQCPISDCDWVIERNYAASGSEIWHDEALFERIYVDFPESEPWNEIWAHTFYTDRSKDGFYIYRNKSTTEPTGLNGVFP